MHTTGADLSDEHLSPTERREAVASIPDWRKQRKVWEKVRAKALT